MVTMRALTHYLLCVYFIFEVQTVSISSCDKRLGIPLQNITINFN
jgi:hypothetical protein